MARMMPGRGHPPRGDGSGGGHQGLNRSKLAMQSALSCGSVIGPHSLRVRADETSAFGMLFQ